MFNICIDSPVPSALGLKKDLLAQMKTLQNEVPNFQDYIEKLNSVEIPKVLGLPVPIFSGYSNTQQELMEVVDAIKYQADTFTMMNIFKPLASVIGGSLDSLLPKIPVLNISILDIVDGGTQGAHSAIKKALEDKVQLPFLPKELMERYSNTAKESLLALKLILVGYKDMLLSTMQSMITKAMDILKISGVLPTLPAIPTVEQLKQNALSAFPEYKSWSDLIGSANITSVISALGIGSFVLPEVDFIPNYSNFEMYLTEAFNQAKDYFTTINLSLLVDFVKNTLGVIGFSFPLFCIGF